MPSKQFIREMANCLGECSDELADALDQQWMQRGAYATIMRNYERDMRPVYRARELLALYNRGEEDLT